MVVAHTGEAGSPELYDTTTPEGMGFLAYEYFFSHRMGDPDHKQLPYRAVRRIVHDAIEASVEDGGNRRILSGYRKTVIEMLLQEQAQEIAVGQEPAQVPLHPHAA